MSSQSRIPIGIVALGLAALAAAPGPGSTSSEAENYRLLQAMPRERRVDLAENLERFDRLPKAEQAAIRRLDARIAAMDPVEQARYRSVLRRFHLWVNGLTADQRQALAAADNPEARFALARQYRIQENQARSSAGPRLAGIRIGYYGLHGPIEVANYLRIWNALPPARQAEVAKRPGGRLFEELKAQRKTAKVEWSPFPTDQEKEFDRRLEADPDFLTLLGPIAHRHPPAELRETADRLQAEADRLQAAADRFATEARNKKKDAAAQKNAQEARTVADEAIAKAKAAVRAMDEARRKSDVAQRRFEHPFAEYLYFEQNKPRPVDPRNLERFATSCPAWLRAMTDPLAPDDAREFLTIVYRQLYPHPAEIPAESKAAKPAPTPKSAPRKAGPAGPL